MKILKLIGAMLLAAALAACGGNSSPQYSTGGTVSGLNGTLVISMDYISDTETLSLSNNGGFTFSNKVVEYGRTKVTIQTNPANQICHLKDGDNNNIEISDNRFITSDVTNIRISCENTSWRISTGTADLQAADPVVQWTENAANNANYSSRALATEPRQAVYSNTSNNISIIFNSSANVTSATSFYIGGPYANHVQRMGLTQEADSVIAFTPNDEYFTRSGNIYTYAHSSTVFSNANLNSPKGMVADASGNLYVSDSANFVIKKIDTSGTMTVFAGSLGNSGPDDGQGTAAKFTYPWGLAIDASGNLYVADSWAHTIRKISPTGLVSTLAGTAGSNGSVDGTGADARFKYPKGVATDTRGNVYVADTSNNTIRKITPSGVVTTLAGRADQDFGYADGALADARFNAPTAIAVDSAGTIYVGDNNAVRRIKCDCTP